MSERSRQTARVSEEGGALSVVIPMPRRWFHRLTVALIAPITVAWLVGHPVIMIGSILGWPALASGEPRPSMSVLELALVLPLWLIVWLGPAAWFSFSLAWLAYGREVVRIEGDTLTLCRETPLYRFSQTFDLGGVHSLRAVDRGAGYCLSAYPWASDLIYFPWHLAFQHRGRTIRFAGALDGGEAVRIVREIGQRFPSLGQPAGAAAPVEAPQSATEPAGVLRLVMPIRSRPFKYVALFAGAASLGTWMLASGGPQGSPGIADPRLWLRWCLASGVWAAVLWTYWILWLLLGREEVVVDDVGLTVRRLTPLYARAQAFDLRDVRALHATPDPWVERAGLSAWERARADALTAIGLAGGYLAFDYRGRSVRFGIGLDEARAREIVAQLAARFPSVTEMGG